MPHKITLEKEYKKPITHNGKECDEPTGPFLSEEVVKIVETNPCTYYQLGGRWYRVCS